MVREVVTHPLDPFTLVVAGDGPDRAAFEAGWLQPTWPREHGGRSLGLRDAMEVRIEGALRSAPKLPNIQGPGVAAPGIRQFGTPAQIERLLGTPVHLDLHVKVAKDWQRDPRQLRKLGF